MIYDFLAFSKVLYFVFCSCSPLLCCTDTWDQFYIQGNCRVEKSRHVTMAVSRRIPFWLVRINHRNAKMPEESTLDCSFHSSSIISVVSLGTGEYHNSQSRIICLILHSSSSPWQCPWTWTSNNDSPVMHVAAFSHSPILLLDAHHSGTSIREQIKLAIYREGFYTQPRRIDVTIYLIPKKINKLLL